MTGIPWSETEATAVLAAMRAVALADQDGDLTDVEAGLIEGARDHIFGSSEALDALPAVSPRELAATITDPGHRATAVQLLVLVPYADTRVDAPEVACVDAYAEALGTATDTLRDLHRVRDGHIKRLMLDYGRRAMHKFSESSPYGPLRSALRFARQHNLGDKHLRERWAVLAEYPAGTLGRTFHDFYRARGFPLPGERHGTGELLVNHDCTHILSGHNTDGPGELEVAGFEAGMSRDGFGYELLLEVILDLHLGIDFGASTIGLVPKKGELDPDRVTDAIRQGIECNLDLIQELHFWTVADHQVEDLRNDYNIRGDLPVEIPPPDLQRVD
jgi:hypothetical protein